MFKTRLTHPKTTQALHWIAQAKTLEQAQNYPAAITIYDQAIQEHPNDHRLHHERGLALARLQQFDQAISSYDRALQLKPHSRDLHHERGDTLLELHRYTEAITSFDAFLRCDPHNAHILGDRGYALYQLGRHPEALTSLNQAIKYSDRNLASSTHAHYYKISALIALGQLDLALQASHTAIQKHTTPALKSQQTHLINLI
jgi:Flp pilus assembly protein TadD